MTKRIPSLVIVKLSQKIIDAYLDTSRPKLCLKRVPEDLIRALTTKPKIKMERLSKPLIKAYTTMPKIRMEGLSKALIQAYLSMPKISLERLTINDHIISKYPILHLIRKISAVSAVSATFR